MSLTKDILGCDISKITLSYLNNYFSMEREETENLEFKSADTAYANIFPEISAFLNTNGGIIIIGTPKEKERDNNGTFKGKIKYTSGKLEASKVISNRDDLNRTINGTINPPPGPLIRIKDIEIGDGFAFIIEVNKSYTPPHQVNSKGAYYIRMDREAKGAPHGIVQALFGYRQYPFLTPKIEFFGVSKDATGFTTSCRFEIENNSMFSAEFVSAYIVVFNHREEYYNLNFKRLDQLDAYKMEIIGEKRLLAQDQIIDHLMGLRFNTDYPLIELYYYCKDVRLEKITGLYDLNKGFTFYHSNTDEDNAYIELLNKYCKLNKIEFKTFINSLKINHKYLLR